jgi:hypothetical protein
MVNRFYSSVLLALVFLVSAVTFANDIQKFPEVVKVVITERNGSYRFDVTLSSPYDTPERYADAFRVLDADGKELGIRVLLHDHAYEQPFTRSLTGVNVPQNTAAVFIEGRDKTYGWSGVLTEVEMP